MRYDRLHAIVISAATLVLLSLPVPSFAAVDCSSIQSISSKESFKAVTPDLRECINRGWPVPPDWVPDQGKGPGLTAGGAGGFSYGGVKAPESPPGSRHENASISAAAITASCTFPPRIKFGIPPSVSFPPGTCYSFLNNLFKDSNGYTSTTAPPPGVDESDTCPADSNNIGLYGAKVTAKGTIAAPCGAMVPIATADLTLNAGSTELATTTNGSYYLWTYRKTGSSFGSRLSAVQLPSYLCGATDGFGLPIKTVDLTPPTEQMITYKVSDGYVAIRLQSRATMPSSFIPPYHSADPEKFLVLPLDPSTGDPIVPPNCGPDTTFRVATTHQDILVQSAIIAGSACVTGVPTMVNYPVCPDGSQPSCGAFDSPHSNWVSICNPSNPPPPWDAKILPVGGVCPASVLSSACSASGATIQANCDVVNMPVPASAGPTCKNVQQFSTLNRPELFYPPGTNAVFNTISGRTQLMAATVTGSQLYMQTDTIVTVQSTAPPLTLAEGGRLMLTSGSMLLMNAPATLNPGSGTVNLPNGGQLVSSGGVQQAIYSPGATYVISGGQPYILHVGRSLTLPTGYLLPTVPTAGSQPPYMQMPVAVTPTP